ncbi:thioesterase II family protein [Chroococcus sp. FPU101]|uniref:thioesterase II family protein n=1 Tax=Chroococcus sp. FPU101 TaxID=1974212 RepID=UPI001A8C404F|nr:thioesterase II family protein [Chroococcus sp. FPU101]GFE67428.1 thioesterase [Chroococcus sp. FPU101]
MSDTKRWVTCPKPNPNAKLRLFCFPYAGGSAWVFRPWLNHLPSFIELCPLELPGRGKRWTETPFTNLDSLIQTLGTAILPHLNRPFAFFGHSMGAMISFELTRLLSQKYEINPVYLFVSGCRAPQLRDPNPPIYNLPEPEFIAEIRRLNGTPDAVLENAELMELVLPALRADFEMLETYKYTDASSLNCPIAVFGGLQDIEVSHEDLQAWQVQTNQAFSLQMFEGNHFFIDSARSLLLTSITTRLGF